MRRWTIPLASAAVVVLVILCEPLIHRAPVPAPEKDPDAPASILPEDEEPPAPEAPVEEDRPQLVVITNVPGAAVTLRVLLYGGEPDPPPVVRSTGEDGAASFDAPRDPAGVAEIRCEARAPGYVTARGRMRGDELRLTLVPGSAIRGRVVDGPGSPVHLARFSLGDEQLGYSGPDGRFELFMPKPGEQRLTVKSRSHLPAEVTVVAPADGVLIALDRGLTISGRVTFPSGLPVPGVLVQCDQCQARTGEDGRYVLSGFGPDDTRVEVRCSPEEEPRFARAGDQDVDHIFPEHVVLVRVVDERGRPFRRGSISISGYLDGDECYGMEGLLGAEPTERLDVYEGTELRITPFAPGWAEETTKVLVDGEPRYREVDVVMRRPPPPRRNRAPHARRGRPAPALRHRQRPRRGGQPCGRFRRPAGRARRRRSGAAR